MRKTARAILAIAALVFSGNAGAYEPRLDVLQPQGGQRGTELSCDLVGPRLGIDPQDILFYEPGIAVQSLERVDDNRVRAKLLIQPDCPLGRHAVRLRTTTGVSSLRTFHVGALPEVSEVEPNSDFAQAQEITFGTCVNGVVQNEDIDHYLFEAKAGDRVSIEIEGLRMGRTFFDPFMELLTESGKVIAHCDDTMPARQDAFLSISAPSDGKYVVRVRESAYRGNGACTYRLHIGQFPRPVGVFPLAAARGQEVAFRWIDDASSEHQQAIKLPNHGDAYPIWPEDERGVAPSPLEVKLLDTPPAVEAEPNNGRNQATAMSAPGWATGVLDKQNDLDCFVFESKKGQVWDIRSHARRLRSPVDAILRIYNAGGGQIAANDDDRGQPDSYIRFTTPEDGKYTLRIEERLARGGPQHTYLLEVTAPAPLVDVVIEDRRRFEATVAEVPQGGCTAVMLTLNRRDLGSPESLLAEFPNLPQGITAQVFPLPNYYNRTPVVFTASADAPMGSALTPIKVQLADSQSEQVARLKQQTWFARGRNDRDMWSHFSDRAAVAVIKPLPFRLRVEESSAPLVQGGVKHLKVMADRNEGFDAAIRVYTLYDSPGVSSNRSRSIPKGQNEVQIPITANGNARTGEWPSTIVGELNQGGRVYACTPPTTLTIAEPYFDMKMVNLTASQGESAEITIELNHRRPFDGQAELKLVRLPQGVTADPVKVNKDSSSATFQVAIAPDAPVRRHRGMGCQATLTVDDDPVVCTQGYNEVRIDPGKQKPVAASEQKAKGGQS